MWARDLPVLEADPDPLRRGLRSTWRHAHWIAAGSTLWSLGFLLALHTAEGSMARAVVTAGVLTIPGTGLLAVIGNRIVVAADCDTRAIRAVRGRTWLRVLLVPAAGAALALLGTAAVVAYPGLPSALALVAMAFSGAALLAHTLLAPTACTLALYRPEAPWHRLWLVAFVATSARPVPILGAFSAVGLLAVAVWHVQILLFLAPGVAAIVLAAAAWAALLPLGVTPGGAPGPPDREPHEHRSLAGEERSTH